MIGVNHLVKETTISQPTISRILNDSKEYTPSRSTIRSLCDFFKVPYEFLADGILTCKKCFEDVNFNIESHRGSYCYNCNSKLYHFIPIVTIGGDYDKIEEFQIGEIKKMIGDYKLLYSNIKDLIEKVDKENMNKLSFEDLIDFKDKLNLKKDVYQNIEELIQKHNDRIDKN